MISIKRNLIMTNQVPGSSDLKKVNVNTIGQNIPRSLSSLQYPRPTFPGGSYRRLFSLFFWMILVLMYPFASKTSAQCSGGEVEIKVEVTAPSNYADDISWELVNTSTSTVLESRGCGSYSSDGSTTDKVCVPCGDNLEFRTFDDYGDNWNGFTSGASYTLSYTANSKTFISKSGLDDGSDGDGSTNCGSGHQNSQRENTESFTPSTPGVSTSSISNISCSSADGGGSISATNSPEVTDKGLCWSTSSNPTTSDNTKSKGGGTGSFTATMSGLDAGTTYYVRAYATNNCGTSYGSEKSFTTNGLQKPVLKNTAAGSQQTGFKHLSDQRSEPVFTISAPCGGYDKVQFELNTKADFTGTTHTYSESGTFSGSQKYDFKCSGMSLNKGTIYYVRARISLDGGSTWSNWSNEMWPYTYVSDSEPLGWHFTSKKQFDLGSKVSTNYGNYITRDNNGTSDPGQDDYCQIDQGSFSVQISDGSDQTIEEGGTFYAAGYDYNTFGHYDCSDGNYDLRDYNGWRFRNVPIPQGASISSASVSVWSSTEGACSQNEDGDANVYLHLYADDHDDCAQFTSDDTDDATGDPQVRKKTSASIEWDITSADWSTDRVKGTSPDISALLEEVVKRAGFSAGNAIGLMTEWDDDDDNDPGSPVDDSFRYITHYDDNNNGPDYAPRIDGNFTNFSNEIQFPNAKLSHFYNATAWDKLHFDADESGCGSCDVTMKVYDASNDNLIASGTSSPVDLGGSTASEVYVVAELKRNSSPQLHDFTLTAVNSVLPVEMASYEADCQNGENVVTWTTASETNNDRFILERSADGTDFEPIETVNGAGNTNSSNDYSLKDPNAGKRSTYYRLIQVDFNGRTDTLGVVAADDCEGSVKGLTMTVAENQGGDKELIVRNNGLPGSYDLKLIDISGRTVYEKKAVEIPADGSKVFDLPGRNELSRGLYTISLHNETERVTRRVMY